MLGRNDASVPVEMQGRWRRGACDARAMHTRALFEGVSVMAYVLRHIRILGLSYASHRSGVEFHDELLNGSTSHDIIDCAMHQIFVRMQCMHTHVLRAQMNA